MLLCCAAGGVDTTPHRSLLYSHNDPPRVGCAFAYRVCVRWYIFYLGSRRSIIMSDGTFTTWGPVEVLLCPMVHLLPAEVPIEVLLCPMVHLLPGVPVEVSLCPMVHPLPGVPVEVSYSWLLGRSPRNLLCLGFGYCWISGNMVTFCYVRDGIANHHTLTFLRPYVRFG
jgi:hypothetical protein